MLPEGTLYPNAVEYANLPYFAADCFTGYEHCWPEERMKVCPPRCVAMCRGL